MKIAVRILQIVLSLWIIVGAAYMMSNYASLSTTWASHTFPAVFWLLLGAIQILLALGLLISSGSGPLSKYATPSAVSLAVISLLGTILYSSYAGFPGILWALLPAALLLFIAQKLRN